MTFRYRSLLVALGLGGGLSAALVGAWIYFGVHMNLSGSVVGTLWYEQPFIRPARGMYVLVCLPDSVAQKYDLGRHVQVAGSCGGYVPLLKRIVAIPGDAIKINHAGLSIEHTWIPNSRPYSSDGHGIELPVQSVNQVVPSGYIAVLGDTVNSFDSRYFGLISLDWVASTVQRLL